MEESKTLFWALVMKPDKRYEQTVESAFHISKACLEPEKNTTNEESPVSTVYVETQNGEFIICNLNQKNFNESLDISFEKGEKICLRTEGGGTVHLTGYLIESEDPDYMLGDESGEEDDLDIPSSDESVDNDDEDDEDDMSDEEKGAKKKAAMAKQVSLTSGSKNGVKKGKKADVRLGENGNKGDELMMSPTKSAKKSAKAKGAGVVAAKGKAEGNKTPMKLPQDKSPKAKKTPGKAGDGNTPKKQGQENGVKTPKRTLKGGLIVEEVKVGNGPEATSGKLVGMYYEGKLKANNKSFDACKTGKPFKFRLGKGEVIKGWDIGVEGMKVGGKRRLIVPPALAYGAQGSAPDIPPNAYLVFDVECKFVN